MPRRDMDEGECVICGLDEMVFTAGPYRGCCSECTLLAQQNPD